MSRAPNYDLTYAEALEHLERFPSECPFCGNARAERKSGGMNVGRQPRTCGDEACRLTFRRAYQADYDKAHRGKRPNRTTKEQRRKAQIRRTIGKIEKRIDALSEKLGMLRSELTALNKPVEPDQRELFCDSNGNLIVGVP